MSVFWIILTAGLVATSCALLGCFMVLRRMSMLGDAISHAVLPGIVIAFLVTHSRASVPMFVGAAVLGILTTVVVQWLSRGGVQGDAAIGVTFTAFFAFGVLLVARFAGQVDLDLDCVLYGEIAYTPFDTWSLNGVVLGPRPVWINGGLLLLNGAFLVALYKELKLCSFDPALAAALGLPVAVLHYALMAMVSITTVGAFESVGAILVVALLIVPAATAYLLTDRLERMLGIAVAIGCGSSVLGYYLARALDGSIAGAIAAVAGICFTLTLLFSPSHGVVVKRVAQSRLRRRVADEDVLLWAGRAAEIAPPPGRTLADIGRALEWLPAETSETLRRLVSQSLLSESGGQFSLTTDGQARATELLRRHRVYETYLGELGYPTDHLHAAADRVEHHLDPALTAAVAEAASHPTRDPQGKPIPPAASL